MLRHLSYMTSKLIRTCSGLLPKQVEHMDAASPAGENSTTRKSSSPIKSTSQENHQLGSGHIQSESTPEENHQLGSEHMQCENTQESHQLGSEHVKSESTPIEIHELGSEYIQSGSVETTMAQGADPADIKLVEPASKDSEKSMPSSKIAKASLVSTKRTYMLRSSDGSARVLRSRSYEASKAPVHHVPAGRSVNVTAERKKKRKKEKASRKLNDEFSRTRKRLRYLLTRMSYEKSLIDAYSGEGWKGQSSEKIKPEKELQRATTEILRCKQKIRILFQDINFSCAEGRLQESLLDSNGQIYSEDIFCSKCGSKDLTIENDIILCDGMCYRGFHQMCLEPPLLKEEIPPGDEGWLCPGCDCKVDCIDLLNDSQGTDVSVDDHWEKVFPEAAAAIAGDKQDGDLGLPSDDTEDDDYDPDGPQNDGKAQTEYSSSEESDFTSASEDSRALPNDDLYLGLPSDDPEDDNYDPNVPDHDDQVKKESSSSDFTSDSEDFSASGDDSKFYGAVEVPESLSVDDAKSIRGSGESSTAIRKKNQSVNSEPQALLGADPNALLVSGKRNVERLDYKKLHDETYGTVPSDSSDDEDWAEGNASRKGRSNSVGNCTMSPKENSSTTMNGTNKDIKRHSRETEITPKRNIRRKLDIEGANKSACCKHKDGPEPCTSEKLATASTSRSLRKAATQRLSESLRENQYPDRETKEKLVKELGITLRQVSKWFEHARRRLRLSENVGKTYGNFPSDSSDDEDWTEGNASRKGKSNSVGNRTISPKGKFSTTMNGTNKDIKRNSRETEMTPKRNTRQKLDIDGVNKSVSCKLKDVPEPCTSEKLATASPSRSLGKAATQRLSDSLKENRYPDRATKEKLVKELGITLRQVSKWFENARRSLRLFENVGVSNILTQSNSNDLEPEPDKDAVDNVGEERRLSKTGSAEVIGTECFSGNEDRESMTEESSQRKSASSKPKKSWKDDEESDEMKNMEIPKKGTSEESPRTQTTSINDRTPKERNDAVLDQD